MIIGTYEDSKDWFIENSVGLWRKKMRVSYSSSANK